MDAGSEVTSEVTSPDLEVSFEAETVAEIAAAAKVSGWHAWSFFHEIARSFA